MTTYVMRAVMLILLCSTFVIIQVCFANMPIGLACLTDIRRVKASNVSEDDPDVNAIIRQLPVPNPEWTPEQTAYIFSAPMVGQLTMLVSGTIVDKSNAKWLITIAVGVMVITTVFIPILASISIWAVVAVRFLLGVACGFAMPAVSSIMTRWFHAGNRSVAVAVSRTGWQIGVLAIVPLAGQVCIVPALNWQGIYYVSAIFGVTYLVVWIVVAGDQPSSSRCISKSELSDIELSFKAEKGADEDGKRSELKVPWKQLLTSGAVWANVVGIACHELPMMTVMTFLPSVMADQCPMECNLNALISSAPYFFLMISSLLAPVLASLAMNKLRMSLTRTAKLSNGIASLGLGAGLFLSGLFSCENGIFKIIFWCVGVMFAGFHTPGCITTQTTVAPLFAGTMTSLSYFTVSVLGMLHPIVIKNYVGYNYWLLDHVFMASGVLAWLPLLVYSLLGSGEEQAWAKQDHQPKEKNEIADANHKSE